MSFENREIFGSIGNVFKRIAPIDPAASYGPRSVNDHNNHNCAQSGGIGTRFNLGERDAFR